MSGSPLDAIMQKYDLQPAEVVHVIAHLRRGDLRERETMLGLAVGELKMYLVANNMVSVPQDGEPDTDPSLLARYVETTTVVQAPPTPSR